MKWEQVVMEAEQNMVKDTWGIHTNLSHYCFVLIKHCNINAFVKSVWVVSKLKSVVHVLFEEHARKWKWKSNHVNPAHFRSSTKEHLLYNSDLEQVQLASNTNPCFCCMAMMDVAVNLPVVSWQILDKLRERKISAIDRWFDNQNGIMQTLPPPLHKSLWHEETEVVPCEKFGLSECAIY